MPSHTPAGNCRTCGYAMDPGQCPECGTICMDVRPVPRPSRTRRVLALVIGLAPLPAAFLTYHASKFLYRCLSAGLVPGDTRFNRAYERATDWTLSCYFFLMPVVLIGLTVLLVRAEYREYHGSKGAAAVAAVAVILGVISWMTGSLGLLLTMVTN
ncbi:MAG: hypothetical protein IT438_02845 [Phycisphaerales bacterium]|nr:hypothetical protein [Phycisphaerales bacterium]